jgi:hypothetical protein
MGFMRQAEGGRGGIWGILGGRKGARGKKRKLGKVGSRAEGDGKADQREARGRAQASLRQKVLATKGEKIVLGKGKGKERALVGIADEDEEGDEDGDIDDEDDGEGEGDMGEGVICDNGWMFLRWLIKLWEGDQADHIARYPDERESAPRCVLSIQRASANQPAWSPAFLLQLPHPYSASSTLQLDDAALPLRVIRAGIFQATEAGLETAAGLQISGLSKRLLALVCLSPTQPHAQARDISSAPV